MVDDAGQASAQQPVELVGRGRVRVGVHLLEVGRLSDAVVEHDPREARGGVVAVARGEVLPVPHGGARLAEMALRLPREAGPGDAHQTGDLGRAQAPAVANVVADQGIGGAVRAERVEPADRDQARDVAVQRVKGSGPWVDVRGADGVA